MTEKLSERLDEYAPVIERYGLVKPHSRASLAALLREAAAIVRAWEDAPVAQMDTRSALGVCAPTEEDFPALYALQGKRVRIVTEVE